MINIIHPYLKYAQALIMVENNLTDSENVLAEQIKNEIEKGLDTFTVQPKKNVDGKTQIPYIYCRKKIEKGDSKKGIFLSPNILSDDQINTWSGANNLLIEIKNSTLDKHDDVTKSIAPITGEYLSFSLKAGIGRGKPKTTLLERGLSCITTLTQNKPCLQYRIDKKGETEMYNVCLIPNMDIAELVDFVSFYKRMLLSKSASDLMVGNVVAEESGKGDNKRTTYSPKRPLIFKGNFPNPPRSSALGAIALLGAIGEFAKEAEYSDQAKRVLESLKNTQMYLVKYGGATVFTYNHHVIDLAKESKLRTIVDSIYYSQLYKGKRFGNKDKNFDPVSEYQKFDLFTSRFLQLFNHTAFKDFLSFRAEYPENVTILFNTYFNKIAEMEKIDSKIVSSARAMGKWLNQVAYFAAKAEIKENSPNYKEELRKAKSKGLIEIESSIFCAKSGRALVGQTITRACRLLMGTEAPNEATLFIDKTNSGDILLDDAKNMLIAYSRLNPYEKKIDPLYINLNEEDKDLDENEDLSNE